MPYDRLPRDDHVGVFGIPDGRDPEEIGEAAKALNAYTVPLTGGVSGS